MPPGISYPEDAMQPALYRAERPEVFEEIIGQKHIVRILQNQI
jgi:DNA polymerase III gamma/tau subunit